MEKAWTLQPSAAHIDEELRKGEAFSIGLIACSGSGKTSSIFSLGRKHFLIYMDPGAYESPFAIGHQGRRGSLETDSRFAELYQKIGKMLNKYE